MDKKKTRATIGIAALGGIIALGYAYTKHNTINKVFNRLDNRVGEKKHNILRWKDKATFEALDKAEKKVKDLKDKNVSERDIAW
tara:strand:- start:1509 stop:1760 length:252 start_codon:yes stop_codon:yes gene_type:complete